MTLIGTEHTEAFRHPLFTRTVERTKESLVAWVDEQGKLGQAVDRDDRRAYVEDFLVRHFASLAKTALSTGNPGLGEDEETTLRDAVQLAVFGTPWEHLLDPAYSDVFINGPFETWAIERRTGNKIRLGPAAKDDADLVEQLRWVAEHGGRAPRRIDEASPTLNMRLNSGARIHAVLSPIVNKTSISIRQHSPELARLTDLESAGMMDSSMRAFFDAAVKARKTCVLVGSTGAGKTTLARALLNEVHPDERIVTVEDDQELQLSEWPELNRDLVEYEARQPNIAGEGAFTMEACLRESLRQNPSRVVVGEVRGGEVFGFLLAISNGLPGSLCTVHAASTHEAFERLALYSMMSEHKMPREAVQRLIGSSVDFVIHIANTNGRRAITSIREVTGNAKDGGIASHELWGLNDLADGRGYPTGVQLSDRMQTDLARHGFNPQLLTQKMGAWPVEERKAG